MNAITPTQRRLLEAAAARGVRGLHRIRGGYSAGLPPAQEVFTIRTAKAAEREGLVTLDGFCGDTLRITRAGRAALAGDRAGRRAVAAAVRQEART